MKSRLPELSSKSVLSTGAALALAVLVVLLISCFTALTAHSAEEQMTAARQHKLQCTDYYAAETAAVEIIDGLSRNTIKSPEDKNGCINYESCCGSVEISRNESTYTFAIPADDDQMLQVVARIHAPDAEVLQWKLIPAN